MPYARVEDIDERVRGVLPLHAQEIFMDKFNSVVGKGGNEIMAFRISWAAVKKAGYRKNLVTGMWEIG